jgi:hypothetical protein
VDTNIGELLAKGWSVIFRHNVTGTTAAAEDYFAQVLQREPENISATIGLAAHYVISVRISTFEIASPTFPARTRCSPRRLINSPIQAKRITF